eukprot:TRINITY_DN472_c1_g1_i2.p2 TRINITY_DN472_c1_g1~~TRINITY_DN472_c1_g1_i2.p2  ORF type:complete len:116 (-),score=10.93 TRINITY_DN472_c1_g1_i2:1025-1372(-)
MVLLPGLLFFFSSSSFYFTLAVGLCIPKSREIKRNTKEKRTRFLFFFLLMHKRNKRSVVSPPPSFRPPFFYCFFYEDNAFCETSSPLTGILFSPFSAGQRGAIRLRRKRSDLALW